MRIGNDKDVADLLGISQVRLKARIAGGNPMPPFIKLPGLRRRRWNLDDVEAWIIGFAQTSTVPANHHPEASLTKLRRPGRPTKVAQARSRTTPQQQT